MTQPPEVQSAPIRVYGTDWCPDCFLAKRVLDRFAVDYEWIDITGNDEAIAFVVSVNRGYRSVPTIVLPNGQVLTEPSGPTLSAALTNLGFSSKS